MKKSDITTEMFEAWKAEMREVFKNDPNSMNMIAFGLRTIDDIDKQHLHDSWNKRLLGFYENELARKNELVCEHCGNKMEVYYTVKCFHCLPCKPKIENHEGNYLHASKWLKNNEPEFDEHMVWDYLVGHNIIKGNDSYIELLHDGQTNGEYNKNIRLFKKHFPIENIKWFVSW
jgi:hypothetical protein